MKESFCFMKRPHVTILQTSFSRRDDAVAFLEYLDTLPVIYDCYVDGWGYMTASMQESARRTSTTPRRCGWCGSCAPPSRS